MYKRRLVGALALMMSPMAMTATANGDLNELSFSITPAFALAIVVLVLFTCIQLWMHADSHKKPFASRLCLSLAAGVFISWLITEQLNLSEHTQLLSLAIVLALALSSISHIARMASFEGLRTLLLQEVAQKTVTLEDKNLELKSTQRQLRIANIELKALSFTDALTGAYNRLYFDRQFLTEWQRARREQEPLSMILVDIDHFKELNDQHGHIVGDQALKFITDLLKKGFQRGNDIVCRYGGEEFVVLLPNTEPAQALQRADKVRQSIASTAFNHEGCSLSITASFGVGGLVPQPNHEPLGLLHDTDQALYHVKRNGRNGCHLATTIQTTDTEESLAVC